MDDFTTAEIEHLIALLRGRRHLDCDGVETAILAKLSAELFAREDELFDRSCTQE